MQTTTEYLETPYGARIAYRRLAGSTPGVVFLCGFMSDMQGEKASAVEHWCQQNGRACVRFDYQGHGKSSGSMIDGCISSWTEDALAILDQLTQGPQILIGSSMGGWIALLAARARPQRVAGLIGIAAAPDFTARRWHSLCENDKETILREGHVQVPSAYDMEPYILTRKLFEDGANNRVLTRPYHHDFPIRLIHGTADPDVPADTATQIAGCLTGKDVEVIMVPGGDHRLSEPEDLKRLMEVISTLIH